MSSGAELFGIYRAKGRETQDNCREAVGAKVLRMAGHEGQENAMSAASETSYRPEVLVKPLESGVPNSSIMRELG